MLPYLRLILFAAGAVFCFLLGATAENFIIDVIRIIVPISPENVILFNALNIVASATPILCVGILLHVAIGSERGGREVLWTIIRGVVLSVCGFRVYQVAWVLKSGVGSGPWSQQANLVQFYAFEKILPFLIIGILSFIPVILVKTTLKVSMNMCISSVTLTFIWLLSAEKLQLFKNIDILIGYGIAIIITILALYLARKIDLI